MRAVKYAVLTLLLVAASAKAPNLQAADGWKLPNLNPFNRKATVDRGRGELTDSSRFQFKFPKPSLPMFKRDPAGPLDNIPETPSARFNPLQKLNNGARTVFAKTKETISRPFSRDVEEKPPTSVRTASRENAGSWGPSSFFNRGASPPEPMIDNTVDFLKQSRPQQR